ncbi:MAG: TolC family protein [Candidatus Methanoperedens sp.]|nr:TolC family protein [Candidatus Methanoperedens sp.]
MCGRPNILLLFLLIGLAANMQPCQAEAAPVDFRALSLDDCLALARQYNPVLAASREKVQELVSDYQAARSKFFPRLVLLSYYDRQPPNRFPPSGNPGPFRIFSA